MFVNCFVATKWLCGRWFGWNMPICFIAPLLDWLMIWTWGIWNWGDGSVTWGNRCTSFRRGRCPAGYSGSADRIQTPSWRPATGNKMEMTPMAFGDWKLRESDYRLIVYATNGLQSGVDGRVEKLGNVVPDTIQIGTNHRWPVVTVENAVRIDHWYDFEFSELTQSWKFSKQVLVQVEQFQSNFSALLLQLSKDSLSNFS